MKFSERMGLKPILDNVLIGKMSSELRNGLWNVLHNSIFEKHHYFHGRPALIDIFSEKLWMDYFKKPTDERQTRNYLKLHNEIRNYYFSTEWFEAYDFLEFCISVFGTQLCKPINFILERELAGYRVVNGIITPITSEVELKEIQKVIDDDIFPGAKNHLMAALELLSQKTNPDYRNSIKESISAVESACCTITGNSSASLGDALKVLGDSHSLHGALKAGFMKIYGYTSDGDGIRHAMSEEPNLTQADAIYFLVSCSAFVNYLKSKKE